MSPFELTAMAIGFAKIHGDEGLSEAEADDLWIWMQDKPTSRQVYH